MQTEDALRHISAQDLRQVGIDQLAYIRVNGDGNYHVHAADGQPLVILDSYPSALAIIRQHNMHPVTLH